MHSWLLWDLLLIQRSPYPLFIRLAPRAYRAGEPSFWNYLTVYTLVGLLTIIFTIDTLFVSELFVIVVVVFLYPSALVSAMSLVFIPFVVGGGIFYGLRTADQIASQLHQLNQSGATDSIATTPDGRWGMIRAISAATLRHRRLFAGSGVYTATTTHLTFTTGVAVPIMWIANAPTGFESDMGIVIEIILASTLSLILIALIHLDYRQYLMLGVTAGVFSGTRDTDRQDAQVIAWAVFGIVGMAGAVVIAMISAGSSGLLLGIVALPSRYWGTVIFVATLLGYALALALREAFIVYLWRLILQRDGIVESDPS